MYPRITFILGFLMLGGCVTTGPNQTTGAALGGLAGGLLGSQIGGGSGRLIGTGVGASIGTMVGSMVGESMDRHNMPQAQQLGSNAYGFNSAGEAAAYNRGRSERQAQIQAQREHDAYLRGYRGY